MNTDPLRVLIVPSSYPHEGKPLDGVFVQDQARVLCRAGMRVDVAFVEPRSLRSFHLRDISRFHFQRMSSVEEGVVTLREKGWSTMQSVELGARLYVSRVRRLINSYISTVARPAVLHAHNALWAGYAATQVGQELGIPVVITEHSSSFTEGSLVPWSVPYILRAYDMASQVVTVSVALQRAARSFVSEERSIVIPNVVDTEFFCLPAVHKNREPFSFLAIAGLIRRKGLDVLLRSFAMCFRGRADARLRIGGNGPEDETLRRLATDLGIGDQVTFLGELTREEVRKEMWAANAFVLSSRHETFGVVLIEALATGLPVVATTCGGPEEFVVTDVGLLVAPEDENALSKALKEMYAAQRKFDPSLLRSYALEHFGADRLSQRLRTVYERVAGLRTVPA
jgi:glycosyltransferase involved in cell wall biosynthesis